jgi:hypothetical protein
MRPGCKVARAAASDDTYKIRHDAILRTSRALLVFVQEQRVGVRPAAGRRQKLPREFRSPPCIALRGFDGTV